MKAHLILLMILFALESPAQSVKTQEKFNQIVDDVSSLYKVQIEKLGSTSFVVYRFWKARAIDAYAVKSPDKWMINISGSLYRHKDMTDDGLALTVCHEIGHLIGGAPYADVTQSSVEGQADFWATSVCFKKYAQVFRKDVTPSDPEVSSLCSDSNDFNICQRILQASLDLATFLARHNKNKPNFLTSPQDVTTGTVKNHPDPQCRLETLKRGFFGEKRPVCWFNPYVDKLEGHWKKLIRSKTIFGLKKGKISINFINSLEGDYTFVLEPNPSTDTAQYVSIIRDNIQASFENKQVQTTFTFNFKFIRKAEKRKLDFNLIVLRGGLQVGVLPITFETK